MSPLSPRSQAIARAAARRMASLFFFLGALALAFAMLLGSLAFVLPAPSFLLSQCALFLAGEAPAGSAISVLGPLLLALLAFWWARQTALALPLLRIHKKGHPCFVFFLIQAPLFMQIDRVMGRSANAQTGPILGQPLPPLACFEALSFLDGHAPPKTLRDCAAPLLGVLSQTPRWAAQCASSCLGMSCALPAFALALAMLPAELFWLLIFWGAPKLWSALAGASQWSFSPRDLAAAAAGAFERLRQASKAAGSKALDQLASEGARDLARAEENQLRAQSPAKPAAPPPRL